MNRWAEFIGLYIVFPTLLIWFRFNIPLLFFVLALAIVLYLVLRKDPTFNHKHLWKWHNVDWKSILSIFVPVALLLSVFSYFFDPDMFFFIPRYYAFIIPYVLVIYPLLSIIPQIIIWRVWFVHRYAALFSTERTQIIACALVFCYSHIVFMNVFALALTLPVGLLFAWRYIKTKSMAATFVEHTLYGAFAFMVGFGPYFFEG